MATKRPTHGNVTELPDGAADATGLTPRQQRVLADIKESIEHRGYPPSMREIGERGRADQLLQRGPPAAGARGEGLPQARPQPAARAGGLPARGDGRPTLDLRRRRLDLRRDRRRRRAARPRPTCPVVGRIAAGGPILAEERVEDVFPLPKQLVGEGTLFLLEVSGDSMIDAAICNGDYVVIRQQQTADNGDIVAAMIDGEATVKTLPAQATARSGCCRTTTPTTRSTAPTPRSSARSPRSCAGSDHLRSAGGEPGERLADDAGVGGRPHRRQAGLEERSRTGRSPAAGRAPRPRPRSAVVRISRPAPCASSSAAWVAATCMKPLPPAWSAARCRADISGSSGRGNGIRSMITSWQVSPGHVEPLPQAERAEQAGVRVLDELRAPARAAAPRPGPAWSGAAAARAPPRPPPRPRAVRRTAPACGPRRRRPARRSRRSAPRRARRGPAAAGAGRRTGSPAAP